MTNKRRISFFVHHQGRGHANRTMALVSEFSPDRPVTVLTAGPQLFDGFARPIDLVALPNMIGGAVPTPRLYAEATPSVLHCVPLGLKDMRRTMRTILDHLDDGDCGLFVVDVSAEIALLSRIASVPAVQIRMHGDRGDVGHVGSYEASVGMLAPFDERIEQDDYPAVLRAKTFYSGGLSTTRDAVPERQAARAKLKLPPDREVIVVLTGGGGSGTPYAPLTVGARAAPDSLWLTLGPTHREGHETDFSNLTELGWVPNVTDYLAAADLVMASAGDNTVHEIARVGRPFVVIPEWRYFGEQVRKAEAFARVGAAVHAPSWPGDIAGWQALLAEGRALDGEAVKALYAPDAAKRAARWLETLTDELWNAD
ncbi:glycosyltransferase [Aureimonas leprariae]|uniref:UDP-N-acetylglucosamine--N-acetylmuramyl-(Pentapeptide) pyrophosphoryl-undecaprenol N-acetylglucosamine transferase n=1 Tax=Plantimonas leprariae TaxID=2615207 RepID=A0A7V7U1T1_9HYPH|nr:glycosyltransferase [Aureimonas leprariae]KAB0682628.1 UDP-N-acetylglucosamine--N-acetylmuramyl-(pentapeptide) pyrophosphoryl-undecaprenol N-acetylglucosamine transferase [Aureimonas leprariae]